MFFDVESLDAIARAILLSAIAVIWIVIVVRVIGLRAFSKMTAFDFVVTVATGSLLAGASQATSWPGFVQPTIAIASLLGVQYFVAQGRLHSSKFQAAVQNTPVLLMSDGKILDSALSATRVTKDDLIAKLREANALNFSEVRAVVLETTGDISVLHGSNLNEQLLDGVQRSD
jgi:uncharacterized membrane protein YcaP (DUF421 family)